MATRRRILVTAKLLAALSASRVCERTREPADLIPAFGGRCEVEAISDKLGRNCVDDLEWSTFNPVEQLSLICREFAWFRAKNESLARNGVA